MQTIHLVLGLDLVSTVSPCLRVSASGPGRGPGERIGQGPVHVPREAVRLDRPA